MKSSTLKDNDVRLKDEEDLDDAREDSGIDYGDDTADDDEDFVEEQDRDSKDMEAVDDRTQQMLLKEEEEVFNEQLTKQKETLNELKAVSLEENDSTPAAQKRINFLMAQSEVFTSFLMGGSSTIGKEIGRRKKKGGALGSPQRRGRMSEKAEDSQMAASLDNHQRFTRLYKQPGNIRFGTMRPYQLEGLNWLIRLHDSNVNGILADEMGLGKTLQTISLLAYLREARGINGPHMVIVPKSTVGNWMREIRRWCPSIRALKFVGDKDERKRIIKEELISGKFDACVLSFEVCIIEKSALRKFNWRYLIIDEAHRVKNEHSKLSLVIRDYKVQHRMLITGTPLQNNLHELWALLNFLLPDVFSSSEDFNGWFNMEEDESKQNVIKKLHTILRPFLLRRLKKDVEHSLPPKTETKLYIGISDMQREWYAKVLKKDAVALNAMGGADKVRLLNILMQLRKVCNHPYLFEGAEPTPFVNGSHLWENAGKMSLLDRLLPKLKAQGSRVLIFSQMTRMLDILEDYMLLKGHGYCRIDGSTKGDDRDEAMDVFNMEGSEKFAFLLSTRAGGLGINLATADIVVLYDSDWNPQVDLQAMDRAHRIGQMKPVRVFRFITEGTIEEKIVERAEKKLYLDAAVIQQGRLAEQNKKLSKTELMQMVKFGADEIFQAQGGTLTDDDIDALLAKGDERTQAMKTKIQEQVQYSLDNFSFDGGDIGKLYDFEGESYDKNTDRLTKYAETFIPLPQRERKSNYNENTYFRETLNPNKPKSQGPKPKQVKGFPMSDWQFFNKKRINELLDMENAFNEKKFKLKNQIKELHATENRNKKKAGGDAPDQSPTEELESEKLQKEHDKLQLSEKQKKEKERLLAEGFKGWRKSDFTRFIMACAKYGRRAKDQICEALEGERDDVAKYYDVFWSRYKEIDQWQTFLAKIEKGEQDKKADEEIEKALKWKCSQYRTPWQEMSIVYGQNKQKTFNKAEDSFLVCMMRTHGYREWEAIKLEVRKAWQFRFDWYFKSRSAKDLEKRGKELAKLVQKEYNDVQKKGKDAEKKLRADVKNAALKGSKKDKKRSGSTKNSDRQKRRKSS